MLLLALVSTVTVRAADPRTDSWLTSYSAKYARIYTTDANRTNGLTATTWSNGQQTQSLPAYVGVQEVYSSANWVYIRTTGLGTHTMGPWYNNAARTTVFVNMPANQKAFHRFPRTPVIPGTKVNVGGEIGYMVDGVKLFDARDAVSYSNSGAVDGDPPGTPGGVTGDGIWNRDAYVNEAITFDPALAHQQNTGVYHYHASPLALRSLLGDQVDFNAVTKLYTANTNAPTRHSPILAWANDGFPIYGPFGYSSASNSAGGVRRMISGFVPRNGSLGTTNLASTGRTSLPLWAQRVQNRTTLTAAQYGPAVSANFPLSRYAEDNDYLGDLGFTPGGGTFDLDEYNGRWCSTPEFPGGTYAYFNTISANGAPAYPYNVGRQYYGTPSGGTVTTLTETVTTNFVGGANAELKLGKPSVAGGNVTLVWSATEGGTYRVESTTNFTSWTTNTTTATASGNRGGYTNSGASGHKFFKVARTALANYDPVSGTATNGGGGGATFNVPGGSVSRGTGTNITLSITLPANPPSPPANAPITSVTLGTLTGTGINYAVQGTVTANFAIPANATLGAQNVVVTFQNGPPPYTFTGGFTINP